MDSSILLYPTIGAQQRILIATDGSLVAQAAVATAVKFPWPRSALARAVVAYPEPMPPAASASSVLARLAAEAATRALNRRWHEPDVVIVDKPPIDAILGEEKRFRATAIVLGWRGHGTFRRLLAGSVSRSIAARAACPVLIVREAPRAIRRLLVGFDGSPNATRALDFICTLAPSRASRVVVMQAIQPMLVPASVGLLPASIRRQLQHEVRAINRERREKAAATVSGAVTRLENSGWPATGALRVGAPLATLLRAAEDHRADVVVLGARAVNGVERLLLGSVANGALNRSKVPVLLVR